MKKLLTIVLSTPVMNEEPISVGNAVAGEYTGTELDVDAWGTSKEIFGSAS